MIKERLVDYLVANTADEVLNRDVVEKLEDDFGYLSVERWSKYSATLEWYGDRYPVVLRVYYSLDFGKWFVEEVS